MHFLRPLPSITSGNLSDDRKETIHKKKKATEKKQANEETKRGKRPV